jgi:hypothetical protein
MFWLGKIIFQWEEPKSFTAIYFQKSRQKKGFFQKTKHVSKLQFLKQVLLIAAILAVIFMIPWFLAKIILHSEKAISLNAALLLSICGSIILALLSCIIPYLDKRGCVKFQVRKKGMACLKPSGNLYWLFKKCKGFYFFDEGSLGNVFEVQIITSKEDFITIGGISREDGAKLKKVLQETIGLEYRESQHDNRSSH